MARVNNGGGPDLVLAQAAPSANSLTALFTGAGPGKKGQFVKAIRVINLDSVDRVITVEYAPSTNGAAAPSHTAAHTFHSETVTAGQTKEIDIMLAFFKNDELRVKIPSGAASIYFTALGN